METLVETAARMSEKFSGTFFTKEDVVLALQRDKYMLQRRYLPNFVACIEEIATLVMKTAICSPQQEVMKADRHNQGKVQWSLVDFKALEPFVRVLEFGAKKYSRDNWRKGLNDTEIMECIQRHLVAMFSGEELDRETGLPHQAHIMCNCMFLSYQQLNRKTDGSNTTNVSRDASGGGAGDGKDAINNP